jgi:hypothetical protein
MAARRVYRVQSADGRGPWRPGFSQQWIDQDAPVGRLSETIYDLVPPKVLRSLPSDMHYGCACRSVDALMAWFTSVERERLRTLGYYPVSLMVDAVLAESEWQMLVGRIRHFSEGASRLSWSS